MLDIKEERDAATLLRRWEDDNDISIFDPVPFLTRLAELVEEETENYMRMDPDPFDERHPSRADPNCGLGQILKLIFKKDNFVTKLINDYMRENYWIRMNIYGRDVRELNIAACRLMVDILPGLETSAVFESPTNDSLIQRLYTWAEKAGEPLQTYATALLASGMEVQELAVITRDNNNRLIPILLDRLHSLQTEVLMSRQETIPSNEETSATRSVDPKDDLQTPTTKLPPDHPYNINAMNRLKGKNSKKVNGVGSSNIVTNGIANDHNSEINNESEDSSSNTWAEMETYIFATAKMYPPTISTKEVFILKYLTPMGEYQEFLTHLVEKKALSLILHIIDPKMWQNSCLTFQALRYLAAILCHKKFAVEFVNMHGLEKLLEIPRPGISATGVSICLYYLAHCEDTMERICLLPSYIINKLVKYGLWLLECSHDSGRCHATMFFGLSFQFRIILKEFDAEDGLRKMYNVCCMLSILSPDEDGVVEDEENSGRQIVRHVCTALKRYLEAHLHLKAESIRRASYRECPNNDRNQAIAVPGYKANKQSPGMIRQQIELLQESMHFKSLWQPVHELTELGGITLLLRIIALASGWHYSGRSETVKYALDAINICAVMPQVQTKLCERVGVRMGITDDNYGFTIILSAAEGEMHYDPNVQISALNVIVTCACAPMADESRLSSTWMSPGMDSMKRSISNKASEEALEKVWECIRTSNGIMVLMSLLHIKTPITEADEIRALASQALDGLARSETVRQIIGKLPLFTTGKLQVLMKNPILQDKRQQHVLFQKHAIELMEKVWGRSKTKDAWEASLANMHKASIVAQTKIHFNNRQLFQVIHQHLLKHGMEATANMLQKEANLPPVKPVSTGSSLSPFAYSAVSRTRMNNSMRLSNSLNQSTNDACSSNHQSTPLSKTSNHISGHTTPKLKLTNAKRSIEHKPAPSPSRSLQKNFRLEPAQSSSNTECNVTLDSIITEYLANQHSLCKNPMVTCPPFDLLRPHKCPDPKPRKMLYGNFTTRISRGIRIPRLDQHFIHSRFLMSKSYRFNDDEGYFTTVAFLNDRLMVAGTYNGDVKILNTFTNAEESTNPCHESYISNISVSSDGSMITTSSTWRNPLSALWKVRNLDINITALNQAYQFNDDDVIEFNHANDKLIGTKGEEATIYDISTGLQLMSLSPNQSNHYNKNRATFNITDNLVLSDGVLWDVVSGKEIHKFDKLNQTLSGVFHPNGLEIISNTEVWDIRTYHLLRTVPSLDQCSVTFPYQAKVMYATTVEKDIDEDSAYDTSFKVLDAQCYSDITTVDVKKSIFQIAVNSYDTQIAIVENNGHFDNIDESTIRLYDVGRQKVEEDEPVNEMDEVDDETEGSNSDEDSDDAQDEDYDEDDGDDDDNVDIEMYDSHMEEEDD